MIQPTVGRVVWYWPNGTPERSNRVAPQQPLAAMIAYVHPEGLINIGGFGPNGESFARTSVKLLQDDEGSPNPCCTWMPYQKGQAAKTEALEQKLGASSGPLGGGAGGDRKPASTEGGAG